MNILNLSRCIFSGTKLHTKQTHVSEPCNRRGVRIRLGGLMTGLGLLLLTGCASAPPEATLVSHESTPMYDVAQPPQRCEGSLWNEQGPISNLFVSIKARQVGDIVTIKIVESSTASNNATTQTGRQSSVSGGATNFFGWENSYDSSDKFFNPFGTVKGGLESTFDGSGTTTRSGSLSAYMTARITEILANGDYRIVGTREVTVNNEKQYMMLSGLVRPRDVSADNVVLSTYIADAKIAYSGAGIINDRQQPGWLARMLDSIWPF